MVYAELHAMASGYLKGERPSHTLQPTALVNEAYVRLIDRSQPEFQNRAHFLGVAARVMRQILVDHARARTSAKRGGGVVNFSLNESVDASAGKPRELIAVDDALQTLEREDWLKAKLIEMRFFGGMTAEESGEALGLPVERVRAEIRIARAWLKRELKAMSA